MSSGDYPIIPQERRNQPWCVSLIKFLDSYEDASSLWRLFNVWGKSNLVFDSTYPEIYRILVQAKNEQAVAREIRAEINLNGAQQTKQWAKNFYELLATHATAIEAIAASVGKDAELEAVQSQLQVTATARDTAQNELQTARTQVTNLETERDEIQDQADQHSGPGDSRRRRLKSPAEENSGAKKGLRCSTCESGSKIENPPSRSHRTNPGTRRRDSRARRSTGPSGPAQRSNYRSKPAGDHFDRA